MFELLRDGISGQEMAEVVSVSWCASSYLPLRSTLLEYHRGIISFAYNYYLIFLYVLTLEFKMYLELNSPVH